MIESIDLRFIRCFEHQHLKVGPVTNLLFGKNGTGKTTFLEALYVMSTTRSFRTHSLQELVGHNHHQAKIKITRIEEEPLTLEIHPNHKKFQIADKTITKQKDFFGQYAAVVLAPEHRSIIEGSKEQRRKFIDQIISVLDASYVDTLKEHQKILTQKRALLQNINNIEAFLDQAHVWHEQHLNVSEQIRNKRTSAIDELQDVYTQTYQTLSTQRQSPTLGYTYDQDTRTSKTQLTQEFYAKRIFTGAQRDDMEIKLDNNEAKKNASQGEKATLLLALKFAELQWIEQQGKHPILLLDDIGTTLDSERRQALFEKIQTKENQTFISTCDPFIYKEVTAQQPQLTTFNFDDFVTERSCKPQNR